MELNLNPEVLVAYGFKPENIQIKIIGTGLINRTFLLSPIGKADKYILQQINTTVFTRPEIIAQNIRLIADFLHQHHPEYLFINPIKTLKGDEMAVFGSQYWRLMPYIENSIALSVLTDENQAFEAAKQFGKLSRLLHHFEVARLTPSLPGFHDLALRYTQFTQALNEATESLKNQAAAEIEYAQNHFYLVKFYQSYLNSSDFPNRVMHHDTKISNVLLNESNFTGLCVIDLDTLMPGKFISDLGDMMRTYLCAYSENEVDLSKITIRIPFFEATLKGYLAEMKGILTDTEKELILFAGKYMIYMQALRFLTDFLRGNTYYPIDYPFQNLDRAKNQFKLLKEMTLNEQLLQRIINENLL